MMTTIDLAGIPSSSPLDAAKAILRVAKRLLKQEPMVEGKTFYTREQWRDRRESFGNDAELVITHDGGDLARFFNWDYGDAKAVEEIRKALDAKGFYVEQCTSWYSAVYRIAA